MNKFFILIIFLIFILSCTSNIKREYYNSGELKSEYPITSNGLPDGDMKIFYKSGIVKEIIPYSKGVIIDTIKYFDEQGKNIGGSFPTRDSIYSYYLDNKILKKESLFRRLTKNNESTRKKSGWLKLYDNGNLKEVFYYVDIFDTPEQLNSYLLYDKQKKIDKKKSYYFELTIPDTLVINNLYKSPIKYNSNADRSIGFFSLTSNKLTENYSNINELNLDTIYNNEYPILYFKPQQLGAQIIRGKFTEQFLDIKDNSLDSTKVDVQILYRDFYFEKKIYVQDSLSQIPEFDLPNKI